MPIVVRSKGSFKKTFGFFKRTRDLKTIRNLGKFGQEGAAALAAATPERTGTTAESWGYVATYKNGSANLSWTNSNVNEGYNIAELIQYGHGTGTGGWVEGVDYINPAIEPVMDKIADEVWNEVSKG